MRHGQTNANVHGHHQDEHDPITDLGKNQVSSAARNLAKLIGNGVLMLDERPLVIHHGPLPRQEISCGILVDTLAEYDIHPALIEKREVLAERWVTKGLGIGDYDATLPLKSGVAHETWYNVRTRLAPYYTELAEQVSSRQLLVVSSGGTLGMLKLLLHKGRDGTLAILNRDATEGPDDHNPASSQWYLNKVPNAAIDVCTYSSTTGWQDRVRILP